MKKTILVSICSAIGLFGIIFWVSFVIIAFRNEVYIFDVKLNNSNNKFLYFENDDIKYYSYNGFKDVNVYEKRFIFNTNKRNMKGIIKNGEFDKLLDDMIVFKYNYGEVIESKYRNELEDETFSITKCNYFVDEEIFYIFSDKAYLNICRWFK